MLIGSHSLEWRGSRREVTVVIKQTKEGGMKRVIYAMVAVMVVVGLMGCATMGSKKAQGQEAVTSQGGVAPTIVSQPSNVLRLDKKTQVVIMGSGFKPGQEVRLVITQKDGSISDISSELDPEPKADEFGVWGTAWRGKSMAAALW